MISLKAEYKVKKDRVKEIKKAIEEFVKNIKLNEPGVLIYKAFQVDETSFIHFMTFKDKESEEKHRTAKHTKKFVEKLYPNCEKTPKFINISLQ